MTSTGCSAGLWADAFGARSLCCLAKRIHCVFRFGEQQNPERFMQECGGEPMHPKEKGKASIGRSRRRGRTSESLEIPTTSARENVPHSLKDFSYFVVGSRACGHEYVDQIVCFNGDVAEHPFPIPRGCVSSFQTPTTPNGYRSFKRNLSSFRRTHPSDDASIHGGKCSDIARHRAEQCFEAAKTKGR
jgi:hypothetical protein